MGPQLAAAKTTIAEGDLRGKSAVPNPTTAMLFRYSALLTTYTPGILKLLEYLKKSLSHLTI